VQVDRLVAGEVGYFSASIKAVADARVGDTITTRKNGSQQVSGTVTPTLLCSDMAYTSCSVDNVLLAPCISAA